MMLLCDCNITQKPYDSPSGFFIFLTLVEKMTTAQQTLLTLLEDRIY